MVWGWGWLVQSLCVNWFALGYKWKRVKQWKSSMQDVFGCK